MAPHRSVHPDARSRSAKERRAPVLARPGAAPAETQDRQLLWTWGGRFFGYRLGDALCTYRGLHVGRFAGAEAFGSDGRYLGEIRSTSRLISDRTKAQTRRPSFVPDMPRPRTEMRADAPEYTMYGEIDDFPSPDRF